MPICRNEEEGHDYSLKAQPRGLLDESHMLFNNGGKQITHSPMEKISFQTSMERNPPNSSYIFFFLNENFENLIVGLHVFIILSMFAKFQENQKSISMSLIKCLNFKLWYKIMHKK